MDYYINLGPIYIKHQSQCYNNFAMTLVILFSLTTMESLKKGLHPHSWVTTLLPSATKLRRLCFYTCLSFCSQGGVPGQVHPLGPGTPPPGRYTPQALHTPGRYIPQALHTPGRYIPQAGTSLGRYPPGRYPPAGTPPGRYTPGRYTPQDQVHPLGPGTAPQAGTPRQVHPSQTMYPPPRKQRRLLLRTVRILLECILVFNENGNANVTAALTLTLGVNRPLNRSNSFPHYFKDTYWALLFALAFFLHHGERSLRIGARLEVILMLLWFSFIVFVWTLFRIGFLNIKRTNLYFITHIKSFVGY